MDEGDEKELTARLPSAFAFLGRSLARCRSAPRARCLPSRARCLTHVVAPRHDERGQTITALLLTIPVLLLILLVFLALTVTQSGSSAQLAADAAVFSLQEHTSLANLPPDNPATPTDERKEAFIELALSGELLSAGRSEVYKQLCSYNRWIVGDTCSDFGTNIPNFVITGFNECFENNQEDADARADCLKDARLIDETDPTPAQLLSCPQGSSHEEPDTIQGRLLAFELSNWPGVKVWISFNDLPLPVPRCLENPLQSVVPDTPLWEAMMEAPLSEWRVVVLVEVNPVEPGLLNFFVSEASQVAISCGPLFLEGANPELWKC